MAEVLPHFLPPSLMLLTTTVSTTTHPAASATTFIYDSKTYPLPTRVVRDAGTSSSAALNDENCCSNNVVKTDSRLTTSREWKHMNFSSTSLGHVVTTSQPDPLAGKITSTTRAPKKVMTTTTIPFSPPAANFHMSEHMKQLHIKIRKPIHLDRLEELTTLAPSGQHSYLANMWSGVYMSYYRTVKKIQAAI